MTQICLSSVKSVRSVDPLMTPSEIDCLNVLIDLALAEDLGDAGDVTSRATIPERQPGTAALVARGAGALSGLEAAKRVGQRIDPKLVFIPSFIDGYPLQKYDSIATLEGPMRSILMAER